METKNLPKKEELKDTTITDYIKNIMKRLNEIPKNNAKKQIYIWA